MPRTSVPSARASTRAGEATFTGWHWFWIAVATVAGTALRWHELGTWSFWVDEAHTFRDATMPLHGEAGFLSEDRTLYALTFLGLRCLLDLGWIGTDEGSLRLPFVVAGIVTVPLMAVCGRALVGAPAAVLSACFLAIHPWHLFWSQNARGYGIAVLLAVVAVNRAQRWAQDGRARDLVAALLAIGLGALFHPTDGLLGAALLAFLVVRRIRVWNRRAVLWTAAGTVAAAIVVPWATSAFAPFQDFIKSKVDASLPHFVQTTAYYFRPLSLLAAAVALCFAVDRLGRTRTQLLACILFVPFLLLAVLGGSIVKTTARYAICALPVITWLSAWCCTTLAGVLAARGAESRIALRLGGLVLPLAIAVDFAAQTWSYFRTEHGGRGQWREACELASRRASASGLRVLTINEPTALFYLRRDYWAKGKPAGGNVQVHPLTRWGPPGKIRDKDGNEIKLHEPGGRAHLAWHNAGAQRDRAQLVVLVTRPELDEIDFDGSLWRTLHEDFDLVLHLPCWVGPKDESIYVFVPNNT